VRQLQAEELVIGSQHEQAQLVGDARAVAAERMVDPTSGEEGGDLDPQRFQDRRWQGRHETSAWSQV
jgi:hypothetical protein